MRSTQSAESYVTQRYTLWRNLAINFDYKRKKASRIAEILSEAGQSSRVALELGVGPGGIAAELSRRGMRIIGMDISPDALERAKAHCKDADVRLLRGSGFSLPFLDRSLDLVYASQVLHLFDSPGRLSIMEEVHRVLRPGGQFLFDLKNASSHPIRYLRSSAKRRRRNFPSQAEMIDLARRSGFTTVDTRPGVLPVVGWRKVPNVMGFRQVAHTTFFLATRGA
jgi:ubiquinone/menaquinone biosynthesis C-methylase UbiE